MDTIARVHRAFHVQGWSVKKIVRELHVSCNRTRGRFFNVVDLVNRLETETRNGKQGRMADYLTRLDFIILDELGYLPFAQATT